MALRGEHPPHVMRATACLHGDNAGRKRRAKGQHRLGTHSTPQWSDTAIARTTPCLLALFSIVTLLAARLPARQRRCIATAAWYPKPRPTFADALAAVRCAIWRERTLATSLRRRGRTKPRFRLPAPWVYALCRAA